ncbi:MAG: uroporphyrinogen-III C-methyltransferase [Rhodoferax sp.]|nr:uroporphyrinogen-III C-methyltransferase [Rhodoferax sp.]
MNADMPVQMPPDPGPAAGISGAVAPLNPPAVAAARPSVAALVALGLALLALVATGMVWQRVSGMREQLARQSADSAVQAVEARSVARQAQELTRDTAARLAVLEIKLSEVALQRVQLEDLIQSLSRSRDENLVVDIDSAVRLAQQQAQLTGSVEPLLAALKSADLRVTRAAQPRLAQLQRAITRDITRIAATTVSDTPALLARIDELLRMADEVPLANAVAAVSASGMLKRESGESVPNWWERILKLVGEEARNLLRVSRIEQPEAALLSPEQSFFVRENFKLKLLNARLGLLARQLESARADLASASASLNKYFDPASRKTQSAANLLQQVQGQMKTMELPRVDETLAALTTAAAGR